MNASEVSERIESRMETELNRLRSDKLLLAATGADLATASVLGALVGALDHYEAALEKWAEESDDEGLSRGFGEAATAVGTARDTLAADDVPGDQAPPAVFDLGNPEGDFARAGAGFVAAPMILDGYGLQAVSFFVNEADQTRADRCREFRTSVKELQKTGESTLDAASSDREQWSTVEDGAAAGIEACYANYAGVLEEMGLDPKPVC